MFFLSVFLFLFISFFLSFFLSCSSLPSRAGYTFDTLRKPPPPNQLWPYTLFLRFILLAFCLLYFFFFLFALQFTKIFLNKSTYCRRADPVQIREPVPAAAGRQPPLIQGELLNQCGSSQV
jgi:magnesium-transporting ATPase (P-type)